MRQKNLPKNKQKPLQQEQVNDNLVGFFELLLKIDRRVNPDLYKPQIKNSD
jgi:hypothetical protein